MQRFKIAAAVVVGLLGIGAYIALLRSEEPEAPPETDVLADSSSSQLDRFLESRRRQPPSPPPTPAVKPPPPPPQRRTYEPPPPPPPAAPDPRKRELELLHTPNTLTVFAGNPAASTGIGAVQVAAGGAPLAAGGSAPILSRVSRRTILAGTTFQAQLLDNANTDEPGPVRALLTHPVHDRTGRRVLLPAGTQALGTLLPIDGETYEHSAQIAWNRLVTPDGVSIRLPEPAPSTDRSGGYLDGRVRTHRGSKTAAILVTALTAGGLRAVQPDEGVAVSTAGATASGEAASSAEELVSRWAQRKLARPPTVHLTAGDPILIRVTTDLPLE